MDRRKTFLILATIGAVLVSVPFLYDKFSGAGDQEPSSIAAYFPVQDPLSGKWGFIDREGNPITAMAFDWTGDFRQGRGLAEHDGAMGYIDESFIETEKWAIYPRFELRHKDDLSAFGFFEGRALARTDDGLWGYIGLDGKWEIEPRFAEAPRDYPGVPAGPFSDELAWFQVVEMVERNVLDENDDFVRDEEGKLIKEKYPRRMVGYIDRSGKVAIEPKYQMANDFGEGLAAVRVRSHDSWGFIDKQGMQVISPRFDLVGSFSDGLCPVGVMLEKNNVVYERWGYIDAKGDEVIERRFDEARNFSEGLAAVRVGNKWGYIDLEGDWAIEPTYDDFEDYNHPGDPRPFENGLARVTLDGKRIYIDSKGEQVWPKD